MLTKLLMSSLAMVSLPAPLTCQDRPGAATSVNTPELPLADKAAADSLLVDVRDLDSTIRLDVRYATADNFTGAPLPGYQVARVLLRREPARALVRVQARLRPQGLGLVIFDGYRPVRATNAMVRWAQRSGRRDLIADGYIASRSRHNLGVAVDLTLIDKTGRRPDMGTPYDAFSEAAHTANATGQAQRFRQILVRAMEVEGFINYEKEWWHFSYPVRDAAPFDEPITASSPGRKGPTR